MWWAINSARLQFSAVSWANHQRESYWRSSRQWAVILVNSKVKLTVGTLSLEDLLKICKIDFLAEPIMYFRYKNWEPSLCEPSSYRYFGLVNRDGRVDELIPRNCFACHPLYRPIHEQEANTINRLFANFTGCPESSCKNRIKLRGHHS